MKATLKDLVIEAASSKGDLVFYAMPEKERISVGRSRECDISVPKDGYFNDAISLVSMKVSRVHCSLHRESGRLYVGEAKGKNGTYVNGVEIKSDEKRELKNHDRLKLGDYELKVLIGEEDIDKIEVAQ